MHFYDDVDVGFDSFDYPKMDPPPKEVTPASSSSVVAAPKSEKLPPKRKMKFFMTEANAKMVAELTHFKPVETLQTMEDVYRNLVVFEGNFQQTCNEFRKLGAGMLTLQSEGGKGGARCLVKAGQFVLADAQGSTSKVAKRNALDTFHKVAKMYCYRIEYLKACNALENQVQRLPNQTINSYKNKIKMFKRESIDQELVFSAEFTKSERAELIKCAHKLHLMANAFGPNNRLQLKVFGQPIPALAIVERILVRKDHRLSELYQVIPPIIGAQQIED